MLSPDLHVSTICFDDEKAFGVCSLPKTNSPIHNIVFTLLVGKSGLNLTGTYGGDQGRFSKTGSFAFCGIYSIENLNLTAPINEEEEENNKNAEIFYCSETPSELSINGLISNNNDGGTKRPHSLSMELNYGLDSTMFGKGRMALHCEELIQCIALHSRPWKDHFKSDLRSDQDHRQKTDLRSDQEDDLF
jgi:hypothetical protein